MTPRACLLLAALFAVAAAPPARKTNPGPRVWKGHDKAVVAVAFSPDGKRIATGGLDGKILVREAASGKIVSEPRGHPRGVFSLAFGPDGKTLASAGADGAVRINDVVTGKKVFALAAHEGPTAAVAYSRDGKTLASGGYDGVIILWDAATGKEKKRLKAEGGGRVTALAFSADGTRLISGGTIKTARSFGQGNYIGTGIADVLREWDVGKETAKALSGSGSSLAVSRDGKTIAGGGMHLDERPKTLDGLSVICLLDATGKERHRIRWRGQALAFSPDSKTLASGASSDLHLEGFGVLGPNGVNFRNTDERIRLWDASSARELLRLPQKDAVSLTFSPDGATLAAGDQQGQLTFWDVEAEKRDPTPDPAEVITPPPSDDKLLVGLHADFVKLLEKEKNPALLREANRILNQAPRRDYRSSYLAALTLLRKHRPRAGIPLLLRYVVEHDHGRGPRDEPAAYAETLAILTGVEVPGPGRQHVEALVEKWWRPNKDRITTDLDRMTRTQLQTVFAAVLRAIKREKPFDDGWRSEERVESFFRWLEGRGDDYFRTWFDEDLHPEMVGFILAQVGYEAKPPEKPARENHSLPYPSVALLSVLRKNGDAPELGRIAADRRQNSATRLVCVLAIHGAGESLTTKMLLPLLDAEKKLQRRVVAARLLGKCGDRKPARVRLIALLDDPNVHVRTAALASLAEVGPEGALQKLKDLLEAGDEREDVRTIRQLIARLEEAEASRRLEDDYQSLLEGEPNAAMVRQAARLFAGKAPWGYVEALEILRRARSKAAVPLLLLRLIEDSPKNLSHWRLREYADAVTILTGKEVDSKLYREPKAADARLRQWWAENREKLTTDVAKMSREEVGRVVRELLGQVSRGRNYTRQEANAHSTYFALLELMRGEHPQRRHWWKEELHPLMLPHLLGLTDGKQPFPYDAIPLLVALYEQGEAPLGQIAADSKRPAALRLVCLLALYRAGERLSSPPLLALLRDEKDPERRLVATSALAYCQDGKASVARLLAILDDADEEVMKAGMLALEHRKAAEAVGKLCQVLVKHRSAGVVRAAAAALGRLGGDEAQVALAKHLEATLAKEVDGWEVAEALYSFERATGKRWIDAGAQSSDYYREKAKAALAWWQGK